MYREVTMKTIEDHIQHVKTVLNRLNQANLRIGIDKCTFGVPCVVVLGHVVDESGISPDNKKIKKVLEWEQPKSQKDLQSFLGLTNYFASFIPFYSTLAAPLNKIKNNKKFDWSKEWEGPLLQSFEGLKEALQNSMKLSYPDFAQQFYLATDASTTGIGGVLYQYDNNKNIKFCEISKKINPYKQFFLDDVHFTPKGSMKVANELYDCIKEF